MAIGLPGTKKRNQILASPALLQIEATGIQLSKFTKSLMVFTLVLLYCMFIGGSIYNILNHQLKNTEAYIQIFLPASIMTTAFLAVSILLILKETRSPLVFTEIGIAGRTLFSVKFSDIGGYAWEASSGFQTTGQISKQKKTTLFITANKGWFPDVRYATRMGTSIFSSLGYYFTPDQMQAVEKIMFSHNIQRLPDR